MGTLTFHTGTRGLPGFLKYLTSADGSTRGTVVPAMALVDSDGNNLAAGSSADPTYTQSGALPAATDRSNSATTTSQALIAANTARRGLNIQNIGANNIGVNEFGGTAAIGTPGTYTLAPNASLNVRTNRAVSLVAATATTAFTATEF